MASTSDSNFDLHIVDIQGPLQEQEAMAACNDLLVFYKTKIAETPPLGPNPIYLYQSRDKWPKARYDGLPDKYNINLTCLKPYSSPSQTIYQFAHELGHIYQWPSDLKRILNWLSLGFPDSQTPWNNWFVESCCCALAFLCLDEMARKWGKSRRKQRLMSKVNPSDYRQNEIRATLKEVGISSKEVANWIHKEMPRSAKECFTNDKSEHMICAIEIEAILRKHPDSWNALSHLGNATNNQITDFDKWQMMGTAEEIPLIKALEVFSY